MTIAHDAYLFNPQPFAVTLADHAERLANDAGQGYRCLRDAAIQSFDHNALTRKLADWYGGWDRASILEELPEQASNNADAIAFSFLLLLYGHLASSAPHMSLGLCNSWEAFAKTLERVGWPKSERELLIKGRSFEYLVEKSGCRDVELGVRLEEIWPILRRLGAASTCGSAGWLELADVEALLMKLERDHSQLSSDETRPSDENHVFQRAETMLASARNSQSGLCLILSG